MKMMLKKNNNNEKTPKNSNVLIECDFKLEKGMGLHATFGQLE